MEHRGHLDQVRGREAPLSEYAHPTPIRQRLRRRDDWPPQPARQQGPQDPVQFPPKDALARPAPAPVSAMSEDDKVAAARGCKRTLDSGQRGQPSHTPDHTPDPFSHPIQTTKVNRPSATCKASR
jgi:hypothetical protein